MFFMFLTYMSNFISIGYYHLIYKFFLCIILYYKNMKFKHLIDNIVVDLLKNFQV